MQRHWRVVLQIAVATTAVGAGVAFAAGSTTAPLPRLEVVADNTQVTASCEVHIPPGTLIPDRDGNGVLHIAADNVTVRFAPATHLRGAASGTPWDRLRGVGIRIDGHTNVILRDFRVHGFRCGLVATRADGLRLEGGDASDNYRQRLRSTPEAEDGADWLYPHRNDERKWRDQYGGAVCVERSRRVIVHDLRVRRGQNGILLDRVTGARIYDNDCSFLSGWGLAMWRSCSNLVTRNAFDFCVRGHVEGVYNRGQDSAGILCFEQSCDNLFAENSVTHGGDGFFGFAGREALGEQWLDRERERLRRETGRRDVEDQLRVPPELAREFSARGCNRNLLLGNDFSDASAHGIELTFSEGNLIVSNRVAHNAICGLWGGYSSDTLIAGNTFIGNGGMAYGLERGAINMEHASGNRILGNLFRDNKCAVHLWWDNDAGLLKLPGVAGNDRGVSGNVIAGNRLVLTANHPFGKLQPGAELRGLQLRDVPGGGHVRNNVWLANEVAIAMGVGRLFALDPGCPVQTNAAATQGLTNWSIPACRLLGRRQPVGARTHLAGRHQIIMDEWGPWDHESPLIRPRRGAFGEARFDLLGFAGVPSVRVLSGRVSAQVETTPESRQLLLRGKPGVTPWRAVVRYGGFERILSGTLVAARWDAVFFTWPAELDPREHLAEWRRLAESPSAAKGTVTALDFPYGGGGPRDLPLAEALSGPAPGGDHFGMIARTRLNLPAGRWRFITFSDDGVRVRVNDQPVIENWTWHGPTRDEAVFQQARASEVTLEVEHFEIDGWATLHLQIEPVDDAP